MVEVEVELMDVLKYKVDIVIMMMKMTPKEKEEEVLLEIMTNLKFVITVVRSLVTLH